MDPYYEDEHVTLYHGDCIELADLWADADVLVTDPPYGMRWQSGARKGEKLDRIAGDADTRLRDRVVRTWGPYKPGLVFGTWRAQPPEGERLRCIWAKNTPGMGDLRMPWGTAHEDIHVIGHGWDREATGQKRSGSVIYTPGGRGGGGLAKRTRPATPRPSRSVSWSCSSKGAQPASSRTRSRGPAPRCSPLGTSAVEPSE